MNKNMQGSRSPRIYGQRRRHDWQGLDRLIVGRCGYELGCIFGQSVLASGQFSCKAECAVELLRYRLPHLA